MTHRVLTSSLQTRKSLLLLVTHSTALWPSSHLSLTTDFAGHNHGGQIGLETIGIRWTLPRAVWPVSVLYYSVFMDSTDRTLDRRLLIWACGRKEKTTGMCTGMIMRTQ